MAPNILHLLTYLLAFLAIPIQADVSPLRRDVLQQRQVDYCGTEGATICYRGADGTRCAPKGWKCCNSEHISPLDEICCPNGSHIPQAFYCCAEGGSCQNGVSCTGCTPVRGSTGFVGPLFQSGPAVPPATTAPPAIPPVTTASPAVPPVTTPPPAVPTIVVGITYYTFTITYWYIHYFYIDGTATSNTVTTSSYVTVSASNSADASASFSRISATAVLPTPADATLPPLPSQTAVVPSVESTRALPNISISATVSPAPSEFTGAAAGVWVEGYAYGGSIGWVVALALGAVGLGANLVL